MSDPLGDDVKGSFGSGEECEEASDGQDQRAEVPTLRRTAASPWRWRPNEGTIAVAGSGDGHRRAGQRQSSWLRQWQRRGQRRHCRGRERHARKCGAAAEAGVVCARRRGCPSAGGG
ncbi:Os07g0487666 [Oryza sativa Japonica Group]|uniref:Os07g0487666 protein n=1 Tax=Oryza sativa subsp. japonica TaxID=39947 RepID=A0A0P0X657_ORYSJ|nr:Os07g0487666 [Oryza sativa Japonica Group]